MKKIAVALMILAGSALLFFSEQDQPLDLHEQAALAEEGDDPNGRWEWELARLADPATGTIPARMRAREIAMANNYPKDTDRKRSGGEFDPLDWVNVGPPNVGGRTRACGMDVNDEQTLLAGGISGGLWKTTDGGQTWRITTNPGQLPGVSCLVQDKRVGNTDVWYAGSGEAIGNSASESFSAFYGGNGLLKSIDNGETWTPVEATASNTQSTTDDWDLVWNLAVDNSRTDKDIVFAALAGEIMRSEDGGDSWETVIQRSGLGTSEFTDVAVTTEGVAYATMSSGNSFSGIHRSDDGINFVNIIPAGWPLVYDRVVIGLDPNDPDVAYFLGETPGFGQFSEPGVVTSEAHSLWKYEYLSGDGTGTNGIWTDLSMNLPQDSSGRATFRSQGGYDICIAVSPHNSNNILIGGTNIFVSTDGFTSTANNNQIGGYKPDHPGGPWGYRWEEHHPDQHGFIFLPSDPNLLINYNDGGVYRTENYLADSVGWYHIHQGYVQSQFYTVAIDRGTVGSNVVVGGLQDNGTQWTNTNDPAVDWTSPNLGDGSYCAVADGAGDYYFSRQYARIIKARVDNNGERTEYQRIDPDGAGGYGFINPFILDAVDNNVMYLAADEGIWRNSDLAGIPYNNEYDRITTNWEELTFLNNNDRITALASSTSPAHILYFGTDSRRIYRVANANTGTPLAQDITGNINSGVYTSCIAVDPRDADKMLVVYSNYNVESVYYTENGGLEWFPVGGNLEPEPEFQGAPSWFNDGPSVRYAAIMPVGDETVFWLGTSVGLYATRTLVGENTTWIKQGSETIGNAVVEMIDYREEGRLCGHWNARLWRIHHHHSKHRPNHR